ncbi:MAG: hypothetical protein LBE62_12990 [Azonexus sp.]|jgi:hypothetical protein|nr:hypothetical protein [Azonexus sp.]
MDTADADVLARINRSLENENRALKRALRDEFAKAALTGLLARPGAEGGVGNYVIDAYTLADAMLEVRHE